MLKSKNKDQNPLSKYKKIDKILVYKMETRMKKFLIVIIMLFLSIFTLSSPILTNAESEENIEPAINIFYPDGILEYADLDEIDNVTTNTKYIAYTTSSKTINIINKNSREDTYAITTYSNNNISKSFNSIKNIKLVNETNLIVVEEDSLSKTHIININFSNNTVSTKILQTLDNVDIIDIYSTNTKVYVGTIYESTFNLYETSNNQTIDSLERTEDFTCSIFSNATLLSLTSNSYFITYVDDDSNAYMIHQSYDSDENPESFNMLNDATLLEYYNFDNLEYLIVFAGNNLYLLNTTNFTDYISTITQLKINNLDIFENTIIASDKTNKTIKTYLIDQTSTLKEDKVLISSKDNSLGRFNNVSDIFIQGSTLYVSDTKNDRIQIISNGKCQAISKDSSDTDEIIVGSKPHCVLLDSNQDIYFVIQSNTNSNASKLLKYSQNQDKDTFVHQKTYTYFKDSETPLGEVSDAVITNSNEIFLIDYTNKSLINLTSNGLQPKLTFTDFTPNQDTKLEYIKSLNLLVVLHNNTLYLIDPTLTNYTNITFPAIAVSNCTDISADEKGLYALCNNTIHYTSISNNTMQVSEKSITSSDFSKFDDIEFDIANSRIYAFDTTKQCIVFIDETLSESSLNFTNIHNQEMLASNTTLYAITPLKDKDIITGIIYDNPYFIGDTHYNIDQCIGIEQFGDFYRVLYNEENILKIGFIHKNHIGSIITHNAQPKIKVITTNIDVSIYKYPTLLKYNNQAIMTEEIPTNTYIYISKEKFPVSIDNKSFYLYEKDGKIGFIFSADIVLDDGTHIVYLNTENACVNAIGEDKVYIYDEDKTTILYTLTNEQRIYVESFDKNSQYTKVIFKDADLNTIEGYVKTDYIQMDELDNNKVMLIILIIISVIILTIISITYIMYIKKKN